MVHKYNLRSMTKPQSKNSKPVDNKRKRNIKDISDSDYSDESDVSVDSDSSSIMDDNIDDNIIVYSDQDDQDGQDVYDADYSDQDNKEDDQEGENQDKRNTTRKSLKSISTSKKHNSSSDSIGSSDSSDTSSDDSSNDSSNDSSDPSDDDGFIVKDKKKEKDEKDDKHSDMTTEVLKKLAKRIYKKENLTQEQKDIFDKINVKLLEKDVNIKRILDAKLSIERKTKLLEKYYLLKYSMPPLTEDYFAMQLDINTELLDSGFLASHCLSPEHKQCIEKLIPNDDKLLERILDTELSNKKKLKCFEYYQCMQKCSRISGDYIDLRWDIESILTRGKEDTFEERLEKCSFTEKIHRKLKADILDLELLKPTSEEYQKRKKWLDFVLKIPSICKPFPVTKQNEKQDLLTFSNTVQETLNLECYGMQHAKEKVLDYIFKRISNEKSEKHILALCGPPGIGKTQLAKSLAKCLNLPFNKICLGGAHDSSVLTGHSVTYIGSIPGKIMDGIVDSECLNPIIYLDEIDKISKRHDSEVGNALVHILDPNQNAKFMDDYVGFETDLSKVFWILTFNDETKIDSVLKDRFDCIYVTGYTTTEKVELAKSHLIPEIKRNICLTDEIYITDESIKLAISMAEKEEGVRNLQRLLEHIFERINRFQRTGSMFNGENVSAPYSVTENVIKKIAEESANEKKGKFEAMYI